MNKLYQVWSSLTNNLKLFCLESIDDEEREKEREKLEAEKHARKGKIRKFISKFHYLTEAWVFASNK